MKSTLTTCMFVAAFAGCVMDDESFPTTDPTVLMSHLRDPYALAVEGDYVYWTNYEMTAGGRAWQMWRCDPHDCGYSREPLFQASARVGLLIRNATMYFAYQGGIASCPVSGCPTPTVVVASAQGAMPSAVDDANIYWWAPREGAFFSCPLTGCDSAAQALVTGLRVVAGTGSDDANLYWLGSDDSPGNTVHVVPKDGSAPSKALLSTVYRPRSFLVAGGFVYWASAGTAQWVQRCPVSGCPEEGPEVLAEGQDHPEGFAFDNGALFWTTAPEANGALGLRKILGCAVADCLNSVEELGTFQGERDPQNPIASTAATPLVADARAVYAFSDVTTLTQAGGTRIVTDAALRRFARKPGR